MLSRARGADVRTCGLASCGRIMVNAIFIVLTPGLMIVGATRAQTQLLDPPFDQLDEYANLFGTAGTRTDASSVLSGERVDALWECSELSAGADFTIDLTNASHAKVRGRMGWAADRGRSPPWGSRNATSAFALIYKHQKHLNHMAQTSRLTRWDAMFLHEVARRVRPQWSAETGFASGFSAVSIMSALESGSAHIAIDPFQPVFGRAGLRAVETLFSRHPETARSVKFAYVNETASFGLAWLVKQRRCIDLFLMDDGHKLCSACVPHVPGEHLKLHFASLSTAPAALSTAPAALPLPPLFLWSHDSDDNIVELYHVSKLLSVGGVVLFHDTWLPSVNKTISFVQTNLKHIQYIPWRRWPREWSTYLKGNHFAVFVKTGRDRRLWNSHVDF